MSEYLEPDEEIQDQPEDQPDADAILIEDDDDNLSYRKPDDSEKAAAEGQKDDKKVGNPFAALRVANRNNKILLGRLERVLSTLETQKVVEPAEPEAEEPDYGENPIGSVNYKVDKLLAEREAQKKKDQEREQKTAFEETVRVANTNIEKFRNTIGQDNYDGAIQHIVSVRVADLSERYPDATEEEIGRFIMNEAMQEKVQLAAAGRDPGKVFYEYAVRHGFKPKDKQLVEPKKENAKDVISRQKERDAKTKTIAAAPGRAARTPSVDDFVGMDEDEFDNYIDNLAKQKGRSGSSLKISEILKART